MDFWWIKVFICRAFDRELSCMCTIVSYIWYMYIIYLSFLCYLYWWMTIKQFWTDLRNDVSSDCTNQLDVYSLIIVHCESKNMPLYFCLWLRQMLTNFQNSFTDRLSGKFAIKSLWNIPPHHRCVTILPYEIFLFRNCLFLLKNMSSGRVRQWVFWNVRHLRLSRQICGLQTAQT